MHFSLQTVEQWDVSYISFKMWLCKFWCLIVILKCVNAELSTLNLIAEWRELFYDFPSYETEAIARATGAYIPGAGVPIDVGIYNGRSTYDY